jgi:acylphosphatase
MEEQERSNSVCVRLLITGRVQGVSYRHYAAQMAKTLGIRGWVRNRGDGRVEAFLEGEAGALQRMIAWCQRGPAMASVHGVEEDWDIEPRSSRGFRVRW